MKENTDLKNEKKILVNASNLHQGGGVQVAVSFIDELTRFSNLPAGLVVWVSDEVHENLQLIHSKVGKLPEYKVNNSFGMGILISPLSKQIQSFDVVFTVFGPLYLLFFRGISVVGFAQPWIIYPHNQVANKYSRKRRLFNFIKFKVQSFFYKKADLLLVELDHVRTGLLNRGIGNTSNIYVVRNSLSSIYSDSLAWQDLSILESSSGIKLGFVGRNYQHKNTYIFPEIIEILSRKYGLKVNIYVTFTEKEWTECDYNFRSSVINVGKLSVAQCPKFYEQMDGIIFPSLLECFSATPLEAMAMEKPLFVSDREFNRDVCQQYGYYFDPLCPSSAAEIIAKVFLDDGLDRQALSAARQHAFNFSSANERAERYMDLIMQATDNKKYD